MIKLENVVLASPEQMEFIIEGMRNPMNSWEKSDSEKEFTNAKWPEEMFILGENDHSLMQRLSNAGTEHRKYMRMMPVYVRITAPLYWWKEFDTYKVGTVANSCSTMHKIAEKEFTVDDFSCEHLGVFIPAEKNDGVEDYKNLWIAALEETIDYLNVARTFYNRETDPELKKKYWWQMIQLLPSSYNQTRNVMLNYEVLANIYRQRKNHKLDEWREFCKWIETLPYSELITGKYVHTKNDCVECIYYNQPYNQTSFGTTARRAYMNATAQILPYLLYVGSISMPTHSPAVSNPASLTAVSIRSGLTHSLSVASPVTLSS